MKTGNLAWMGVLLMFLAVVIAAAVSR